MLCRELCEVSIRQPPDGEDGDENKRRTYISAIISSGEMDGHGTYMTERTLRNFAEDLSSSIQFKDSHRRGQGFGVSEGGEFDEDDNYVSGDFKLIRGWPLNDASYPNSDIFIDAIEEGVITRVSVGFSGGRHICSICDDDWYRGGCYHWPGRVYDVEKDGKVTEVLCRVAIDDARLVEVSAVSRGSNPDAQITEKANRCHKDGRLPPDVQMELEDVYGMRFDETNVRLSEGYEMDGKDLQEQLTAMTTERDEAKAKVEELTPLAECGRNGRKYMSGLALEAFKVSRGESVTDAEIERFTNRSEKLDFNELVMELEHLRLLAPAKPNVKSGSQTSQPDESGDPDGEREEKQVKGINPPHWGV